MQQHKARLEVGAEPLNADVLVATAGFHSFNADGDVTPYRLALEEVDKALLLRHSLHEQAAAMVRGADVQNIVHNVSGLGTLGFGFQKEVFPSIKVSANNHNSSPITLTTRRERWVHNAQFAKVVALNITNVAVVTPVAVHAGINIGVEPRPVVLERPQRSGGRIVE